MPQWHRSAHTSWLLQVTPGRYRAELSVSRACRWRPLVWMLECPGVAATEVHRRSPLERARGVAVPRQCGDTFISKPARAAPDCDVAATANGINVRAGVQARDQIVPATPPPPSAPVTEHPRGSIHAGSSGPSSSGGSTPGSPPSQSFPMTTGPTDGIVLPLNGENVLVRVDQRHRHPHCHLRAGAPPGARQTGKLTLVNGVHDMGGMQGYGPIRPRENEETFHAQWEKRVHGFSGAGFMNGICNLDEFRHAIERMPAHAYLSATYYERWVASLETLLVEKQALSREEIEARVALLGRAAGAPVRRG